MMALGKTPQCVPDRRRWKTLVEPKVKRRAGLTGNYSNLCEFIYFTIRKNKERGGSSASKASLETVLPSRKTNPLFLTLDKFWSSRNESRDDKPVQMAFYPQAGEIKFFRNYINWLFVPNSSSVQWKAQLVPIFLGYLENTQILENKNFQKQMYLGFEQNS